MTEQSRRSTILAWVAAALWLVAACKDDDPRDQQSGTVIEQSGDMESGQSSDDADDECAEQDKGAACGADGMGMHCVDERCVFNTCGDGVKAGEEACDDGNYVSGDGCDADCQVECDGPCAGAAGMGGANPEPSCGNGKRDPGEECDDGNSDETDACSNRCKKKLCGNKRIDYGEECDDGNTKDGDDCSSTCQRERCRNGHVDPEEECDDGNQVDGDGCNNLCQIVKCGDGKATRPEECDDGNMVDDDACSNQCTRNMCGNGRVDPGEECDGGQECSAQCKIVQDTCTPCERAHCSGPDFPYEGAGIDWVAGCYDNMPDTMIVDQPVPDDFSMQCRDVVECARRSQCIVEDAGDVTDAARACFCGSASPDECTQNGPAADSKCYDVFARAAGDAQDWHDAVPRLSDPAFPAGYAWYTIACDVQYCKAECAGWLK